MSNIFVCQQNQAIATKKAVVSAEGSSHQSQSNEERIELMPETGKENLPD